MHVSYLKARQSIFIVDIFYINDFWYQNYFSLKLVTLFYFLNYKFIVQKNNIEKFLKKKKKKDEKIPINNWEYLLNPNYNNFIKTCRHL